MKFRSSSPKKSQISPDSILYWVGQLLLLIFILVILYPFVSSVGTSVAFDKNYVVRDLALFIDAVQGLDGDLILEYPTPKLLRTFELKNNVIKVGTKDDLKLVTYPILASTNKINDPKIIIKENKLTLTDNEVLVIKKQGKLLSIESKIPLKNAT